MTLPHGQSAVLLVGMILVLSTSGIARADQPADNNFCYVSVGGENRIAVYSVDPESGALSLVSSTEVDGAPGSLALAPTGDYLYAALRSSKSIATLRVDPASGALEPVDVASAVDNPVYLATDATGRYLLTAYYGAGKVAVYPIEQDGRVGGEPLGVFDAEANPHSILVDRSNRLVFVPNTGADTILRFRLDPETGELTPNPQAKVTTEPGAGPRHFVFHPTQNFVYFVNEKNSTVTVYWLDPTRGSLTSVQTLSTLPEDYSGPNTCADIHITPDGRYVYASNRGHDSIAAYEVDLECGRLKAIGQTPTEKTPREFDIDPTGRFLYSAGQGSGRLASYRIDQDSGELTPLDTYEVGASPAWVLCLQLPKR